MPPPLTGTYKYGHVRSLYNDIHKFIGQRQWAAAPSEGNTAGITWLGMFVLFDISGARTARADHVKDRDAKKRADGRSSKTKKLQRWADRQRGQAIIKPTLQEEMALFKAIVRQVAKHEMPARRAKRLRVEERQDLRRLAKLGIDNHQAAVAAGIETTSDEKGRIIKSFLQQKAGHWNNTHTSHMGFLSR